MNIYRNKMNNCKNYIYIYFSNYNFNLSVLLGEYLFFKTVKFLFVCGLSIVLRDLCILGMNCSTSNPKPFLFADRSSLRCPLWQKTCHWSSLPSKVSAITDVPLCTQYILRYWRNDFTGSTLQNTTWEETRCHQVQCI